MFESLRCAGKGHVFVDSRSRSGTQTCVRCRERRPFEGLLRQALKDPASNPEPGEEQT